ncbi:hypothetical protein ACH5RR_030364 [Cinchona calisaya]|uniref:Uncharacterized protein n=1 Tax=Cinchona calisaya TaxID=153742 RepID=A0ABD2YZK7_9GENT
MASPENPSNHPDHQVDIEEEEGGPISVVDNTIPEIREDADAADTDTGADPERIAEIVLDIPYLLSQNQDAAVEDPNETVNRVMVVNRSGFQVRIVTSSSGHNYSPKNKLGQVALMFFAQLAAVFLGNFLNNKQSSAVSEDPHSYSPDWTIFIVTVTSLIGFIFTLISTSTSRRRIWSTIVVSSATAKFGFAAVAFAVTITIAMAIPLHRKAKIALTAAVSLSTLVAIALA